MYIFKSTPFLHLVRIKTNISQNQDDIRLNLSYKKQDIYLLRVLAFK